MTKATAAAVKPAAETAPAANDRSAETIKTAIAEGKAAVAPIAALLASEIWPRESGIKFNTWEVVPPAGTPFENVLRPDFWANVSAKMRPGDEIIVFPRDRGYYGRLIVWDAGQNWAHVTGACQPKPELGAAPGVDAQFDIGNDPIDGVYVVRKSDGVKVHKHAANHEDARRWIIQHQQALRS